MTTTSEQAEVFLSAREQRSEVWLDHLPLDVCASIASILKPMQCDPWELRASNMGGFPDLPHPASLPLASVSKVQRRAVEAAQAHTLQFETAKPGYTANLVQRWRRVLRADIREVHLAIDLDTYREFGVLLSFPSVSKVSIPCLPGLMRSLMSGGTVKVLQLHLMRSFEDGLQLLPNLLRSCAVEKLRLVCHQCGSFTGQHTSYCATMNLDSLTSGRTYDSLRSLQLVCTSPRMERLIRTLSFFPNLEDFSLQRWTPADDVHADGGPVHIAVSPEFEECMRSMKSVGMTHYGTVDQLVPILQGRMTSFSCHEELSTDDIRKLEACPNLSSIDLVLAEGAECSFPVGLCALRSISLKWKLGEQSEEEYYSPVRDSLIDLVSRNKGLEELRLHSLLMSDETLEDMLACVNREVRVLQLPIFHQGVCPLDRFFLLIRLLMRNCLRLSELEADTASSVTASDLNSHDASACSNEECAFCAFPKEIMLATNVLKRRMPRLKGDGLERLQLIFASW